MPPSSELFSKPSVRMQTGVIEGNSVFSDFGSERRRQNRIKAVLPVQVDGNDVTGTSFQEIAHTLDITSAGVRLGAIHRELKVLDELTVQYRRRKIGFRVVWTRPLDHSSEYQVGLEATEQVEKPWGLDLSTCVS